MNQDQIKDLAADKAWTYQQGISYFNQPTTREAYYDGFKEGAKFVIEKMQQEADAAQSLAEIRALVRIYID